MFIWKLDENNPEVYQLPKGMYFIGDLSYLLFDVSEEGDGIKNNEIFSKDLLEDLDKKVEFYSGIETVIYTDLLGGDGCFEDQDGFCYPIDSGSIGICRVDDQLIENISSNLQSWTSMMFYKKIIVKVQKDKVKMFKPRDLSILRDLGRFINFKDDF